MVYRGADERDEESRFDRILTPTKTLLNYFLNEGRKDPKYFDKLIEDLVYRQMTRTARNAAVELNRWDTAKEISQRLGEMNWLLDAADSRGEFVEARKIAQAIRLNREPVIYEVALEFLKPNNRERILAHANRILKQQTQTPVASQS